MPAWARSYIGTVATALGDAYAEPAKDVEGYIAYVKGQKK
jgi:glutathione S-transferase